MEEKEKENLLSLTYVYIDIKHFITPQVKVV